MKSTLKEYVNNNDILRETIIAKNMNIFDRIKNADVLPCDDVKEVDGYLRKVLIVDDANKEYWPVDEIIILDKTDVEKLLPIYKELYDAYMEQVDVKDLNVQDLIKDIKEFKKKWSQ